MSFQLKKNRERSQSEIIHRNPTCQSGTQHSIHPTGTLHACIDAVVAETRQKTADVPADIGRFAQQLSLSGQVEAIAPQWAEA